jgi:PE-PPE domain/PE family
MTSLIAQPQLLASAAADTAQISSAISAAKTAAAGRTTGLVAAAEDEVSALTTTLFNTYAQDYHAMLGQATAFHDEFAQLLAAAGNTYAGAEAEIAALLAPPGANPGVAITKAADPAVDAFLIMTGSGTANPSLTYMSNVSSRYLTGMFANPIFTSALSIPVTTAEGLYPFTGVKDLTLDISLARGVTSLNNAINLQIAPGGGNIAVLGYSQSSIISSMIMPQLLAQHYLPTQIHFTLLGDPSAPNGGLFARFPGLSLPSLGATLGLATPSNDFPTTIWSLEYDGFADFPQYPIDFPADLNALAGIVFVHGTYPTLTNAQLGSAVTLGQSGNPSMTTYNMIPTQNLPLLDPLRIIPGIGNPLADLVQPDLKAIINWGYGNPAFGWSTGPADIQTPFGFLPPLGDTAALGSALVGGTQQGFGAFMGDMSHVMPASLPALPMHSLTLPSITNALMAHAGTGALAAPTPTSIQSTITGFLEGLETANTNIVGTATTAVSTAYATLLPTADIALALGVTLPSYDFNLFTNGIIQAVNGDPMGLVNAIGNPIAANVGLATVAGGFELIAIVNSLQTILTGAPNPGPF